MNAELQKQFRLNLLLQLDAVKKIGLTEAELLIGARVQRIRADQDAVEAELSYLKDRGLVIDFKVPAKLGPAFAKWRITADGRDFLSNPE